MTTEAINTGQDFISTFDMEERLEYLRRDYEDNDSDQQQELEQIEALVEELGGTDHVLIAEDAFQDYVREMVEDTMDLERGHWLLSYIDWDAVTRDERCDYGMVEFAGRDYYWREC